MAPRPTGECSLGILPGNWSGEAQLANTRSSQAGKHVRAIGRNRFGEAGYESRVLPSSKTSTITRVVTLDGDLDQAVVGQSVTLCPVDEVDCSRGT